MTGKFDVYLLRPFKRKISKLVPHVNAHNFTVIFSQSYFLTTVSSSWNLGWLERCRTFRWCNLDSGCSQMTSRRSRVEVIYGKCRVSDPTLVGFNKEALIYPSSHFIYKGCICLFLFPISRYLAKNRIKFWIILLFSFLS